MIKNWVRWSLVVGAFCLVVGCAPKEHSASEFSGNSAAQLLAMGRENIDKGSYRLATRQLEAIDALYPFAPEAKMALIETIYAYYQLEEDDLALAATKRYLSLYPEDKNIDYVYYMRGLINFSHKMSPFKNFFTSNRVDLLDLSHLREAFVDFSILVENYPASRYVADALGRMHYIRYLLAEREYALAKFYFDRGAYIAAVNRVGDLLQNFSVMPQALDGLDLMQESYRRLNLSEEAAKVQAILQLNCR